ncbi:DNA mismatch repair protein MutS [Paenibacillus albicereus]|uniref:DNA mismatch repair protein MutS n=1 Tax=Paenibacillus albicereus TaxID=2726185 RepID=A0A6H2GY30_9BACL|nr:DNA mismatch repair protein MutS [Paenibacillus albicereus]QJC52038.1 DNA mismatch repair protein MutS [Paenibacillus albicereus]
MNHASMMRLEYSFIQNQLLELAVSEPGRRLAERHAPTAHFRQAEAWQQETAEADALLRAGSSVPLSAMEGIGAFLALLGKGRVYDEKELSGLSAWLGSISQMKRYMASKRELAPRLSGYADAMRDCPALKEEIDRCIRGGWLADHASPELSRIRRGAQVAEDRIRRKLDAALAKYRSSLQEAIVSRRGERFVIPVRRDQRRLVPGTVWDESASGQTLFIEPHDVADLQAELAMWKQEEEQERIRILSMLSSMAESESEPLTVNLEAMALFDFILARGKLSRSYDGTRPRLLAEPLIRLRGGRHPKLGARAVPIHAELGDGWDQLCITGPNTGGKTLALKTLGLFALMAQAGLFLPADEGCEFGLFDDVLADVGDGQSIEQSLSTFSSHLAVLGEILGQASRTTLVLLDELAAGTDPGEGIALSIAVLEELGARGTKVAVTTHFNEIKAYASRTPRCMNARMAFDAESLQPLYRLEPGEAGDSYALSIARRYGLPESLLARAEELKRSGVKPAAAASEAKLDEDRAAAAPRREAERQAERRGGKRRGADDRAETEQGGRALSPGKPEKPRARGEAGSPESPHDGGKAAARSKEFAVGDCVWIHPLQRTGIVFREADARGEVIVQVKREKRAFNRKRLSLYISRDSLYPGEDYDMDIVFDTKENRKARHRMSRMHVPGLQIESPDGDK